MRAKQALSAAGADCEIIELDQRADGGELQRTLAEMSGRRTVPSVFIGGKSIGGSDDTVRLLNFILFFNSIISFYLFIHFFIFLFFLYSSHHLSCSPHVSSSLPSSLPSSSIIAACPAREGRAQAPPHRGQGPLKHYKP
jgi:glutaredoxin 3